MEISANSLVVIRTDIKDGVLYGDIYASKEYVNIAGKTVRIKRVRDGLYSGHQYVIESGEIITLEMIQKHLTENKTKEP